MAGRRIPLEFEDDPLERSIRERRAERNIRSQRVERAGLGPCPGCGGTTEPVEDLSLACVCAARRAAIEARAARIAHDHHLDDGDGSDRSDVIAP